MEILVNWLVSAVSIIIAAYILPGIHVADFLTALIVALILGILNAIAKPVLVLLTLPITILTLGLFLLVINAVLVLIVSSIVPGFRVDGFWWAFFFSIILSLCATLIGKIFR